MTVNAKDYERRIAELRRGHQESKDPHLRARYTHAINLSEESLWVLQDLVACGVAKFIEDDALINSRMDWQARQREAIAKDLKETEDELKTKKDELSLSLIKLRLKTILLMLNTDVSGLNNEFLMMQSYIRINAVPMLGERLFSGIFKPDERAFNLEAAIDGFNFALGLVPGFGDVYSGALTIRGIVNRAENKRETTDEHLTYLADYCHALKMWGVAAEEVRRALRLLDDE